MVKILQSRPITEKNLIEETSLLETKDFHLIIHERLYLLEMVGYTETKTFFSHIRQPVKLACKTLKKE